MPRFYDVVKPSANKAVAPGKEKKAGEPPTRPGKEGKARVRSPTPEATGTARNGPRAPNRGPWGGGVTCRPYADRRFVCLRITHLPRLTG